MKRADGKYDVHLVVDAKKFRADGRGQEHAIPVERLDRHRRAGQRRQVPLSADGRRSISERTDFTLTVDKLPAQAGIDPVDKLIDRNPDDNVIAVKKK